MVTLKDIAREANVSVTTVSNVIHNRASRVSGKTVKKVQSVLEKYNYIPNMSARSLVNNTSKLIGVFFKQNEGTLFENPFNTEILSGIDEVLKQKGYYLLIRSVSSTHEMQQILSTWNVDGVICLGYLEGEVEELDKIINKPVILIDTYNHSTNNQLSVGINDKQGSKMATEYLIKNGHTKIGFAGYPNTPGGVIEKRYLGYLEALNTYEIQLDRELTFYFAGSKNKIDEFSNNIIEKMDKMTALVFTADSLAVEVMECLKNKGITIPNDISIVGFDDITMAKFISPKLTTIRQDIKLKGKESAFLLIELLNKAAENLKNVEISISLIERESVKNLKKQL
ncbi:LacI family transcriptional regulator [Priestia megaterium]|uniref:LacI family DNA-binding transcriptional regulator n=1 Tax=Priestia megaterium TaxID=1404 RepID=UPI000BF3A2C8|nr:LacI family DNA-binding transcriptional regulator [Priestia megaterium]PFV93110.1 LacI family transcriptional regulator [Priestia megaterium]